MSDSRVYVRLMMKAGESGNPAGISQGVPPPSFPQSFAAATFSVQRRPLGCVPPDLVRPIADTKVPSRCSLTLARQPASVARPRRFLNRQEAILHAAVLSRFTTRSGRIEKTRSRSAQAESRNALHAPLSVKALPYTASSGHFICYFHPTYHVPITRQKRGLTGSGIRFRV